MRLIYATRVRCDSCGTEAEVKAAPPEEPLYPPRDPDGWLALGYAEIRHLDGSSAVRDLCPACTQKPFAEIFALAEGGHR